MRFTYSAAAVAAALTLATAGAAAAKSTPVELRVEGEDRSLASARYFTDSTSVTTEKRRGCGGSGDTKQLAGPSALGALVDAALVSDQLNPLGVSDEFDFGMLVCGVGGDFASGNSSFWLYKVNHVAPEVAGEAYAVKPGDRVLWYFADSAANRGTGDELELVAPVRATRGRAFEVRVYAYDSAGTRRPVEGALVTGGASGVRSDASGVARVSVARNTTEPLRATLDPHVPSAPVLVCVNARVTRCPAGRPKDIHGSRRAELIRGTAGPDIVTGGGGRDRILVLRGARDLVRCGAGRDVVVAGRRDRVAADCEVVRRRGRV